MPRKQHIEEYITLTGFVRAITRVFPDAIFSAFSKNNNTVKHIVRPAELLYAKQAIPETVVCSFADDTFFFALVWNGNRVHANADVFHEYDKCCMPDEFGHFAVHPTLKRMSAFLYYLKNSTKVSCRTFKDVLHEKDVVRAKDEFDEDDYD